MNRINNQIQLIGNLGTEVQFKNLEGGSMVATCRLATHDFYRNKAGEKVDTTQWHNLVAWGNTAKNLSQQVAKGQRVAVQGKLVHRSYVDKDGNIKYVSEIKIGQFMTTQQVAKEPLPF